MLLNSLERIVLLPLVIIIAGGVFLLPVMPVYFFAQPSLESLFVVLVMIGLWPMCVAVSHGAFFIEKFIGRSMPKDAPEKYDLFEGHYIMYVRLSLGAGDFLSKALDEYGASLDTKTTLRGKKLVDRHRAIARYVWPGMTISAIGAIGLVLTQILEVG